uniref:hypothetical protein n=1 Tax=Candidatus Electronema sp. TaxID=2698783 RepID=UPI004055FF1B
MPDNPTNPSNQPPTLADMSIDLSEFQLMDIGLEEKRRLPKPLADFPETARQVLAVLPAYQDALRLTQAEFDPAAVAEHLALAEELIPYVAWLEKRAEQVRETRLVHLAESYRAVLKLYHRSQAAAEFDPQVGHAFAFLGEYFGVGKKRKEKEE